MAIQGKTETVKVTSIVNNALKAIKRNEGHSSMDSVSRALLIYRANYLREHPEGLLNINSDLEE